MEETTNQDAKPYLHRWQVLVAGVAAGCALTALGIAVYVNFLKQSGPDIIASGEKHDFKFPPDVVFQLIDGKDGPADSRLETYYQYFDLTIRNNGNLPAKDVRVKLDGGGVAITQWEGEGEQPIVFPTDIPVGDLPLDKSFSVRIWGNSMSAEPTIIHRTGRATIEFQRDRFVQEYGRASSLAGSLVVLVFAVLATIYGRVVGSSVRAEYRDKLDIAREQLLDERLKRVETKVTIVPKDEPLPPAPSKK